MYHSAAGGLSQARHVFLGGNGLLGEHARWRGRESFVIVETGFGLGLNFLATWQAWRDDPDRCARLHFVSFEKHPFAAADLAVLHQRWPQLADCSQRLRSQWPPLLPGVHRLHFEDERVVLTLFLGDARVLLPKLRARADAFYLDGFAPDKNPELWSPRIFTNLARLAVSDSTLATWTVAAAVRTGLSACGFVIETAPGFSPKREMSHGTFRVKRSDTTTTVSSRRSAIVIGAGLAGCAVAERLAARGWEITLIDAAGAPAQGASGNPAGVLRPQPSLDDNPLARLSRTAFLHAVRHLHALGDAGLPLRWDDCGVLYLARDPAHEQSQRRIADSLASAPDYLRFVERDEAAALARWPVSAGGWWFAGGGWVQPASLCYANLQRHAGRIQSRFGRTVARIEHHGEVWHVLDDEGIVIAAAPHLILANATDGRRLVGGHAGATQLPLRNARGQVSLLPQATTAPVDIVVCQDGYLTPAVDGIRCAGASFSVDDEVAEPRLTDHRENLARLDAMLPGYAGNIDPESLAGRVGFRSITLDRMPIIGGIAAPDRVLAAIPAITRMAGMPRQPGLYGLLGLGSRGLVWATLAAELLAAQIEGEPLPLEGDLVDAVDPARFLLRRARRGI